MLGFQMPLDRLLREDDAVGVAEEAAVRGVRVEGQLGDVVDGGDRVAVAKVAFERDGGGEGGAADVAIQAVLVPVKFQSARR